MIFKHETFVFTFHSFSYAYKDIKMHKICSLFIINHFSPNLKLIDEQLMNVLDIHVWGALRIYVLILVMRIRDNEKLFNDPWYTKD